MLKRLKFSQYVAVPNGCLYRSSIRGRQSRRYRCENSHNKVVHVQELSRMLRVKLSLVHL